MTLVMPRLVSAVEKFREHHGIWPTKVIVPHENWTLYQADPNSIVDWYHDIAAPVLKRVQLIPIPAQAYIAIDDEGRYFDYGNGTWGGPPPARDTPLEMSGIMLEHPYENAYVVPGTRLVAGEYPGSPPGHATTEGDRKLQLLLDAGITAFVDLTSPADGLAPYEADLRRVTATNSTSLRYDRLTITDMDICDSTHMNQVLDTIDERIAEGHTVYVHCWGGIGRTGMVVGCHLVRNGATGQQALDKVNALFHTMSAAKLKRHGRGGSPQTEPQRAVVREWAKHDTTLSRPPHAAESSVRELDSRTWELLAPGPGVSQALRDRMRGALIGLAVGDAVGTTVEFRAPGSFPPLTDMVGGGPFGLQPGDWTDDTSMALCLADSLIARRDFDERDQMERYTRWWREGYLSTNGRCFDIGNTVAAALRKFKETGEPFAGRTEKMSAGNGSLMRLAPIPVFFFARGQDAIHLAGESSRTTHGAAVAVDCCRYLAALITGALSGASKMDLLAPYSQPNVDYWVERPLCKTIRDIADGSYTRKSPPAIRGTGYAAESLEAALWAFYHSTDFRHGCLLAANLGDDADTTAAIYGQLAGAYYGESGIPTEWRMKLTHKPLLDRFAETLFQLSHGGPPEMGRRNTDAKEQANELLRDAGGDTAIALRRLFDAEAETKREMGIAAYLGGPMHMQAVRDEVVLNLRIALGVSLA